MAYNNYYGNPYYQQPNYYGNNGASPDMLNQIKGNGVNDSHLVRIPTSQQKKERDEKGHNTKNLSVSGDKAVGHDDEGGKTVFDFIGAANDTESGVNAADRKKLWDNIKSILSKELSAVLYILIFAYFS